MITQAVLHPRLKRQVRPLSAGASIPTIGEVLSKINRTIKEHIHECSVKKQFDPNKFETELKFFCDWFNLKNDQ